MAEGEGAFPCCWGVGRRQGTRAESLWAEEPTFLRSTSRRHCLLVLGSNQPLVEKGAKLSTVIPQICWG